MGDSSTVLLVVLLTLPGIWMFRDTLRGGVEASMRYLYNKASNLGLSSFSDDEINDAERARHIERFRGTHVGGLYNEGNTCFINSVVQSLASCQAVSQFAEEHRRAELDNFSAELADLIMNLNQIHSKAHGYSTARLMANLGGSDRWSRLDQEDAQEFFQQLLQALERDYKDLEKAPGLSKDSEKMKDHVEVGREEDSEEQENNDEKSEDTREATSEDRTESLKLITPFDGKFAMRVGCLACGDMEGIRPGVVSSVDLSLDSHVALGSQGVRLTNLLDNYCAMETIPGVECYRCSLLAYRDMINTRLESEDTTPALREAFHARISEVDSVLKEKVIDEKRYKQLKFSGHRVQNDKTKQTMFAQPTPEVLMIHINRSVFDLRTGYIRKNYAQVQFPVELNLAPYVTDPDDPVNIDPREPMRGTINAEGTLYALKASVIHYGSANFGHYVSFRKFDGLWWRISDDSVDLTTESQALSAQGVFMLFYEKVRPNTGLTRSLSTTSMSSSVSEASSPDASSTSDLEPLSSDDIEAPTPPTDERL